MKNKQGKEIKFVGMPTWTEVYAVWKEENAKRPRPYTALVKNQWRRWCREQLFEAVRKAVKAGPNFRTSLPPEEAQHKWDRQMGLDNNTRDP